MVELIDSSRRYHPALQRFDVSVLMSAAGWLKAGNVNVIFFWRRAATRLTAARISIF